MILIEFSHKLLPTCAHLRLGIKLYVPGMDAEQFRAPSQPSQEFQSSQPVALEENSERQRAEKHAWASVVLSLGEIF